MANLEWVEFVPDERDDLIDRVLKGYLSPKEAEAIAAKRGLEPLVGRPDAAEYDPMQESHWTLAMAVQWIAYREVQPVREVWPAYCEEWTRWHCIGDWSWPDESGTGIVTYQNRFEIETVGPGSLTTLGLPFAFEASREGKPASEGIERLNIARKSLWDALAKGQLIASGLSSKSGEIVDIAASEWPYLEAIVESVAGPDVLHNTTRLFGHGPRFEYSEIHLSSKEIVRIWTANLVTNSLAHFLKDQADKNGGVLSQKKAALLAKVAGYSENRESIIKTLKAWNLGGKQGRKKNPK